MSGSTTEATAMTAVQKKDAVGAVNRLLEVVESGFDRGEMGFDVIHMFNYITLRAGNGPLSRP